jgi:FKBP-type peptidyl-prolyl cis-trans isomerase
MRSSALASSHAARAGRLLAAVASCAVVVVFLFSRPESAMSAEPAEVPHPQLPTGAGKLDADAPKTFQTTASGLKYRVLRQGPGSKPKATNTVKVNYHGWLDGGKVFDSSYSRGEAIEFGLNQVIPGWTEGMQLVGKGGMIELEIPSGLGYGRRGAPPVIPPDATLHFLVELLDVR